MSNLSVFIIIYPQAQDYETENKMHTDTKYEWEKMAAASISPLSCYEIQR